MPLTQKGNLGRAVVIEAVDRFGWDPLPNPPRGEDDVFELWALRALADNLHAVRRSGRRLLTTRTGRVLAADPQALWRAVASRLGAGQDFAAIVRELALAILHDGTTHPRDAVVREIADTVTGEGWHDRATGLPPDRDAIGGPVVRAAACAAVLGMAEEGGTRDARTVTLTPIGQATALQALHARATGPRPDPFR